MLKSTMNKRIYISDMDGTLLRNDASLSDNSRRILTRLLGQGVAFTVASARSVIAIRQALGDLPLRLPVIAINGAFISDYATGRHLMINAMSPELVAEIYSRILKHECIPFISAFDGAQDRLYFSQLSNAGMQWYHDDRHNSGDDRLTFLEDLTHSIGRDHIVSLSVIGPQEEIAPLAYELEEELGNRLENHFFPNPYSPPWWWLTIHDKRSCKSQAVQQMVEYAGFSMDDLVVFGDNLNDVKMFQQTRRAIAVANGTEEIKQYATEVIGSNEEDSVVNYVLQDSMKL
ncbi:MAG: HAD family phosphatase [Sedimentisphaerales bacterium]|nr:HAD family phosphatase [Sedimentisphaerales bacterium]